MANPSKQKGTSFETAVVEYLHKNGFPVAERRALHGNTDRGDIAGVQGWTLELKNRKVLNIGGAVDEVVTEMINAKTPYGAAIIKRPRKGDAADSLAVMPLWQLARIMRLLGE